MTLFSYIIHTHLLVKYFSPVLKLIETVLQLQYRFYFVQPQEEENMRKASVIAVSLLVLAGVTMTANADTRYRTGVYEKSGPYYDSTRHFPYGCHSYWRDGYRHTSANCGCYHRYWRYDGRENSRWYYDFGRPYTGRVSHHHYWYRHCCTKHHKKMIQHKVAEKKVVAAKATMDKPEAPPATTTTTK